MGKQALWINLLIAIIGGLILKSFHFDSIFKKKRCQITTMSNIHLKRRCSRSKIGIFKFQPKYSLRLNNILENLSARIAISKSFKLFPTRVLEKIHLYLRLLVVRSLRLLIIIPTIHQSEISSHHLWGLFGFYWCLMLKLIWYDNMNESIYRAISQKRF